MKHYIATVLLIGALAPAALAQYVLPDPEPEPTSKPAVNTENADLAIWIETLTSYADELAEAAPTCRDEGTRPPSRLMRQIGALEYTPTSILALTQVINGLSDLPAGERLFVTFRLMTPLQYADAETLEAAESLIDEQLLDLAYAELPEWTADELALIGSGQTIDETDEEYAERIGRGANETDDAFAERLTAAEKALDAKMLEEAEVIFTNTNVRAMRSLQATLLLRMDSDTRDKEVVTLLTTAMNAKDAAYTDILTAIRAVDRTMTQERAAWFYDELKALWPEKPNARDTFTDYTELETGSLKNPTFVTKTIKPFDPVLKTINHLATRAKKPALRAK